jgi:hypothetical protein
MTEQIPRLDDEIGMRARSAWIGHTLYFANIPGIFNKNSALIAFISDRVKYSGWASGWPKPRASSSGYP